MESNEYKQIRGKPYNNLAKKTKCMIRCYAGKSQQTRRCTYDFSQGLHKISRATKEKQLQKKVKTTKISTNSLLTKVKDPTFRVRFF